MTEVKKRKSFFLAPVTFFIAALCFISSLSPFVSPATNWVIAVLGLGFYYAYVTNFIFLLLWLFRRRKFLIVPLIPFITGFYTALGFWSFGFEAGEKNKDEKNKLEIMTYNVRIFDLYNWTHNEKTRAKIFKFFQKENPDVLCMQEFHTSTNPPFQNLDTLQGLLKAKNIHLLLPIYLYGTDYWGLATFSSYPIVKKHTVFADNNSANGCIATDIKIGNDTIRIYNVHLQSIRFTPSDYKYVQNISEENSNEQYIGMKGILKRLKKAFLIRAAQADLIAEHIRLCPHKVIVCGDFNDTPSSYTYHKIASSLQDAFINKGSGFSSTYIGVFPAFRIDYLLHSKNLNTIRYQLQDEKLSDHYAVKAVIGY